MILLKVLCLYLGGITLYYGCKIILILHRLDKRIKELDKKKKIHERRLSFRVIQGGRDAGGFQSSAAEERSKHR